MTQSASLKPYEREILRARSRVEVADLDKVIDDLIALLIGKLTKAEHKEYQASRIAGLIGINPEAIIERRAYLLGVSTKGTTSPDVLTREESAELVVVMREIANWLRTCQDAGETDLAFQRLVVVADQQAERARERFFMQYQRYPELDDVPESLMPIAKAQRIKRLADRTRTLMPPGQD